MNTDGSALVGLGSADAGMSHTQRTPDWPTDNATKGCLTCSAPLGLNTLFTVDFRDHAAIFDHTLRGALSSPTDIQA